MNELGDGDPLGVWKVDKSTAGRMPVNTVTLVGVPTILRVEEVSQFGAVGSTSEEEFSVAVYSIAIDGDGDGIMGGGIGWQGFVDWCVLVEFTGKSSSGFHTMASDLGIFEGGIRRRDWN